MNPVELADLLDDPEAMEKVRQDLRVTDPGLEERNTQEFAKAKATLEKVYGNDAVKTGVADWVKLSVCAGVTGLVDGSVEGCEHISPARGTVVMAAWLPGVAKCVACMFNDLLAVEHVHEWTCDRCGTEDKAHFTLATAILGRVSFSYGLCLDCRVEEEQL